MNFEDKIIQHYNNVVYGMRLIWNENYYCIKHEKNDGS